MWLASTFLTALTFNLLSVLAPVSGEKCKGKSEPRKLVEFQEKFIFSPGYPQNYEINDNCSWTFAAAFGGAENVIQLATLEIDLSDYTGSCNTDYLEAYEGEGTSGILLARWCGKERKIVKAQRSLTLIFHSDEQITGKGFIVSFSLIKATKAECEHGQPGKVVVGAAPVYEQFQGQVSVPSCEWQIQSEEPSKKLLLELFKPSSVSCRDGSFDFYDGGNTSSHISYEYCSTLKPFSLMYLRSNKLVITFRNRAGSQQDGLTLKISAISSLYDCTASNMPTIEVDDGSVIFALPLAYNARNTPCPVRLWNTDRKKQLRLDVMGTDDKEADCSSDIVDVKETNNKNVVRSCNRGKNPVYRQRYEDGLIVTSPHNVFMRASVVDKQCNGYTVQKTAHEILIQEETIPSTGHFSNLDYCRFLIRGEQDNAIVHLSLTWKSETVENRQESKTTVCKGAYINVYDGDSEMFPVLFSSCGPTGRSDGLVYTTVQSSQKFMLIVLDADAKTEGESFKVKFHSIPGDKQCSHATQISVNRTTKTLTSSNYPSKFPLNQFCLFNLVAENPEDNIVVKVTESGLHDKCKSFLAVYEGEYQDEEEKAIGRVCGKDTPTFKINGPKAAIVAVSEDAASDGGWRVDVHTTEKENSAESIAQFNVATIIFLIAVQIFCMVVM